MKSMLVPVDFSDSTPVLLEISTSLAKKWNAQLNLFHAVEVFLAPLSSDFTGLEPLAYQEMVSSLGEQYERRLREYASEVSASGIGVQPIIGFGRAHLQIAETATRTQADLIVIGTTGHTRLHYILLGSTTERLLRVTHTPILSVPRTISGSLNPVRKIGIPMDLSDKANQILPSAIEWATSMNAELHLIHVDVLGKYLDMDHDFHPELPTRFPGLSDLVVTKKILLGERVTDLLLAYGQEQGIDLWMQTSQGAGFLSSLLIGSKAEALIRHATQPVFTVRTDRIQP